MFKHADYVMIMVSDMKRSVAFYRDVLGLPLKFESPEWTELATGTTTLALHGGAQPAAAPRSHEKQPAGSCSLGFNVANLDETYHALKGKGVIFTVPPVERAGEGIRLAVAVDPDGLPISFAESKR
jgi:lactoylglutathione lyase